MSDMKTMATKSGEVNPTIPVTLKTSTEVHRATYDKVHSSMTDQFVTYDNRAKAIEDALGCKDSVKG